MQRLTSLLWIIVLLCHYHIVWGSGIADKLHYYETMRTTDIKLRVRRSADNKPGFDMKEIWFNTMGRDFHLALKQSSVLSSDFKATAINGESKESFSVDRRKFLSGKLYDDPDSSAHVLWDGEIMTASIATKDEVYYVEPSWRHFPPSVNHSMVTYKKSDVKFDPDAMIGGVMGDFANVDETVGMELNDGIRLFPKEPEPEPESTGPQREKRQATSPIIGPRTLCRLAVVADFYFFSNMGQGDRYPTSEFMISLIDRVNGYFKRTVWTDNKEEIFNTGFEIAEIIVHESYTDSGDNNHYNMKGRVNDMSNVLDWFGESHVQDFKDVCLGHLFTYQAFRGKLGLAYIASPHKSNLGGICSRAAYVNGKKQAVNTGVSSFQTPGGSTAMSLPSTLTVTHEIGHNWGCEHDPDTSNCSPRSSAGGKYIMYPSSTTGYQANNQVFSSCSRQYVFKVLQNKGFDCFSVNSEENSFPESTGGIGLCGNGRVDKDEECDSGKMGDICCDKDCKLIGQATCSYMNYPCCDRLTCQVASGFQRCRASSGCKESANCNGIDLTCPVADNSRDGRNCTDDGVCRRGVCLGQCQQLGKIPCICEDEGNLCKRCCQNANSTGACTPLKNTGSLPNGSPCSYGFCEQGTCARSGTIVKRLYRVLQYFSINRLEVVMKDNVVWVILLLSSLLWLIFIVIFECVDSRNEKRDRLSRENMTRRNKETILPFMREGVSEKIHFPIIRRQFD
ncbi:ADAM 17-like protease isoform X1 [Mizuhopecten yessoensis]|uniref:ADAM 17-like protease isoform X1 n=1 Tax=Mizuhopecten yessoensis TaxID=6573 RepID=UPI000B457DA9|nr:ADAM 17-like protease isoform X1 [Mizuhopecten yessoensis]